MKSIIVGMAAVAACVIIGVIAIPANGEVSKGASQPWVQMKIAQSETNTLNTVSSNYFTKAEAEAYIAQGALQARQIILASDDSNSVMRASAILIQSATPAAEIFMRSF